MGKPKTKPPDDEPRGTVEHIFRENDEKPKRKIVNQLVRLMEIREGKAQARGERIREIVEKENNHDDQ